MKSHITVNIPPSPPSSYPIYIDAGLISHPQAWLRKFEFSQIVIITDNNVKKLFLPTLVNKLKALGHTPLILSFPAGEKHKTQATKQMLEEKMLKNSLGRDTLCIALGGGVVGDLTGFVAATYLRGIPYIQIPTTLLAMVDSSVGGKTAIDTPQGKNLIGAFWQPKAVIADIDCIQTLSTEHLISGIIEALKMFLTNDAKNFSYLQKNMLHLLNYDSKTLKKIIQQAVTIKADVVAEDEKETNMRMILNFGHTIGHALEKITHYKMLHGYAVGYGILLESCISHTMGILEENSYLSILACLNSLGFSPKDLKKFDIKEIIQATRSDKKNKSGNTHYILLKKMGEIYTKNGAVAHPVADDIVTKAFHHLISI